MSFVHLHNHTEYSLLDGAARIASVQEKGNDGKKTGKTLIKGIVDTAKDMGMDALAITDHGVMFGVINFYKAAKAAGIKPIIGCEVYVAPRSRFDKEARRDESPYHLILLAKNRQGYENLCRIVSYGFLEGFYYKPRVDIELLELYHEGLICLSACIAGELPMLAIEDRMDEAKQLARRYLDIFGRGNYYLELQNHGLLEEEKANAALALIGEELDIPLVATNDVHYIAKDDAKMHDILLCIQTGKTRDEENRMRFPCDEFYLKSEQQMRDLFPLWPQAIENSKKIADACDVDFTFGEFYLPEYQVPQGYTLHGYLQHLCQEGLNGRYPTIDQALQARLDYELGIIEKMGFSGYFLIVWDLINFCHQSGIRVGPGRGSAAGSLVAYCLGITNIDPIKYDLLFERFLNPERISPPDIDTDFCYERRGEVIDYLVGKYGDDKVGQIITFGTMLAKGSVRDVGRVLAIPYDEVNKVAKLIPAELGITLDKALRSSKELKDYYDNDPTFHETLEIARQIEGMPRHASVHAAGVVIAKKEIISYMPVQKATDGIMTTQYEKGQVEECGLLKMDILGLRTLTIIGYALDNIKKSTGEDIDINAIPLDDAPTYKMLCDADAIGVFQLESEGMRKLLKDLQPECFEDMIALVALYRPGPLGSGMVTDFCRAKHGDIPIVYKHPMLEPLLKETYGIILYQEQVMKIATTMAGFTMGQADLLRSAMGKKKVDVLAKERQHFIDGAAKNDIDAKLAAEIFDLMEYFAGYGFNKSHSAAYAMIAYQTAWLKYHYPAEFMAAMMTNVMDDIEKVPVYIDECRKINIKVLPPDINHSDADFAVVDGSVRFALAAVKNVGREAMRQMVENRQAQGPFVSLGEFCSRVTLNKTTLESLIKCGAFDCFGHTRSQLLAVADKALNIGRQVILDNENPQMTLFDFGLTTDSAALLQIPLPDLAEYNSAELLTMERDMLGFYFSGHPINIYEPYFKNKISCPIGDIKPDQEGLSLRLAGTIGNLRIMRTKRGEDMAAFSLSDKDSELRCIVFPRNYQECRSSLINGRTVALEGKLQFNEENPEIILTRIVAPCKLFLRLPNSADVAFIDQIRGILQGYPGDGDVKFYYDDLKQYYPVLGVVGVSPEAAMLDRLRDLLGDNNVVLQQAF